MNSHYRLPAAAIVEVLKDSTESIGLQAWLPPLRGITRENCIAQLILGQGKRHSCLALSQAGAVLLQGEEAYQVFEEAGELDWHVIPVVSSQQKSTQADVISSGQHIPSPRWEASSSFVKSLSHPLRQFALLVDGKRSVEDIARLRTKKPQEVVQLYAELNRLFDIYIKK